MHYMTNSKHPNGGNSQVQSIVITAITLFALAGAILGFSVGALTHHSTASPQTTNNATTNAKTNKNPRQTQVATSPTAIPSPSTPAQPLGGPGVTAGMLITGAYKYVYTLQAKDKSLAPITTNGITCRIWLAKAIGSNPEIDADDSAEFKNIANETKPFPHEVTGLQFDPATPQTQPCINGKGTWNFNISASVPPGKYYMVGLTSNGVYINWSWSGLITV